MAAKDNTPEHGSTPESSTIPFQIDQKTLQRYIQFREKIERDIGCIMAFASLLRQYKECSGDEVLVDLYAVGYVNEIVHDKACDILDELDLFLPLWEVMRMIAKEG